MGYSPIRVLLEIQSALTTHISPSLRAVTIDFDCKENLLTLHFFYDGEITDKLYDLASCASAEVDPGVFPYSLNHEIAIRLDYPRKIPIQGRLVYLRKESTPTIFEQKNSLELADSSIVPVARLLLAMQDALLGRVTPELRRVMIHVDENSRRLDFHFFYDGQISNENIDLANSSIKEASAWFPNYRINKDIRRIDFPEKMPQLGTRCPYERYEGY